MQEERRKICLPWDAENVGITALVGTVALFGVISMLLPKISIPLGLKDAYVPQFLLALTALVLACQLGFLANRKSRERKDELLLKAVACIEKLERFSFIELQTEVFSANYLDHLFGEQMRYANRTGKPLSLLMVSVHTYSPDASLEQMIEAAAGVLRSNFRGSDYIVHCGKENFLVLMPDTAGIQAQVAMDRLKDKLDAWNLASATMELSLRQSLATSANGSNLWEVFRALEDKHRSQNDNWVAPVMPPEQSRSSAAIEVVE
jgi:diguanylate cyclase (GGDEF)-like protein